MPRVEPPAGATTGRPRSFDREEVLQRAVELFWRHGYDGARLSELTEATGVNPPSLYHAFGSKAELFREALASYNAPERSPTRRAFAASSSVREAVEATLRDNVRAYVDPHTPPGCLIALGLLTHAPAETELAEHLRELRDDDRRFLRARFADARARGELPDGADPDALAALTSTCLLGLSIQARDGQPLARLEAAIDLFMQGWDAVTAGGAAESDRPPGR